MALAFLFDPNKQFQSLGGVNEVGGFLRVYLNGTDDAATTYKDFNGTLNEADIVLDANGRAVVIVDNTKTYRLEVYNRLGGLMWTVSNFTAQGGSGGGGTPVSVEGTEGEVDVDSYSSGGILHFVVCLSQTIKDSLTSLSSIVTSLMASIGLCELVSNKKDTLTGYEASTTDYPSIKAVVDFVNSAMQNMGGKLITDNGDPFTDSSDLPSTTPYNGVNIDDKDYAYVQNAGSAERWSATVVGSSVAWVQEYAINIPVFTPAQQAAIDSTATATKINNYDLHIANTAIHVTTTEKNTWNSKQNAISDLSEIRSGAAAGASALQPSGNGSNVTSTFTAASSRTNISSGEKLSIIFGKIAKWFADLKALAFKDKVSDSDISGTIADAHIASASTWNSKQNAISDLSEIRSGAAAGASALQPNGNGSNVTSTFTAASSRTNISSGEKLSVIFGKIAKWFGDLKAVAFSGSYNDLSNKPTIPTVNNGTLTIYRNGTALGSFTANQSSLLGINISVPTKTSDLVNDSFATVATSGSYNDLSNKPSIPSAANNGRLTITQNGTSKGTFTANQSGNVTISLTDTTYENKDAADGSPDVSLVTAGDKFDWNLAYRQLFKLTKYVTGSEATQGTAIELGEFSWGPGYRLRFTISIEDTTSDYTLGINIPFSTGTNQQWNGWLANTGNYEYCVKTEYRVGSSSPDLGVFGNNGTFPGIGRGKRIGDVTIPRFSAGGIPVGMYRGKFLLSGYSDGVKSFVLDVDLCYKCANSGTTWWGYVSLLPNEMHT